MRLPQNKIEARLRQAILLYLRLTGMYQRDFALYTGICPKNFHKFLQGKKGIQSHTINAIIEFMEIEFVHPGLEEQIENKLKSKRQACG